MDQILLSMEKISKSFKGVTALDNVSFDLRAGEIHTLLGENGAGKSTLMKILCGAYTKDSGVIKINGVEKHINSQAAAKKEGIGIVYQELMLAPALTVAENIFMGKEPKKHGFIDVKRMNEDAQKLLDDIHLNIRPTQMLGTLTVAQRQLVEIAKVLSENPKILIMDEPTSSLAEADVDMLLDRIVELKKTGIGIIYISHRMGEIKRITDRATVLRDGKFIKTCDKDEIDIDKLIALMVGREESVDFHRSKAISDDAECVLEVRHLTNKNVKDVSFKLKKGEILGFSGLIGAGRSETMRALFGIDPIESGEVYVKGEKVKNSHPGKLIRKGVAFAPEDRKQQALFLDYSVWSNLSIANLYTKKSGIRNLSKEKQLAEEYKNKLNIQTPGVSQIIRRLSGGNQQKVVISRWLANNPDILILDEPTRGIDVGAKSEIYSILSKLAEQGMSIIVVSSELLEILALADRIIVMHEGRITGELDGKKTSQEEIMRYATASV